MKKNDLRLLLFMLLLIVAVPLFAQSGGRSDGLSTLGLSGLENLSITVLKIFTSAFVKTILTICFVCCVIAYARNRDNKKIVDNSIAIGIATGLLAAASFIVEAVWNAVS